MATENPLLGVWTTPHELPPFDKIEAPHFGPAFDITLKQHAAEVDAIAADPSEPTFDNTVAAWDAAGAAQKRVERVFSNLTASETSPELQAVERALAPRLAAHDAALYLHEGRPSARRA